MKKALVGLGILLAIPLLVFLVQGIAAESGEVVVLRTTHEAGSIRETRLWIVDDQGASWLRAGTAQAGWYRELAAAPDVEVVRGDLTLEVRGITELQARERVNELMRAKYGWADSYISWLVGRDESVSIRLQPR